MKFTCPICDYPNLDEEPYFTFEICPRCHVEFGIEDSFTGSDGKFLSKDSPERKKWLQKLRDSYQIDGPFDGSPPLQERLKKLKNSD